MIFFKNIHKNYSSQKGFTLVEFMIATAAFSLILLVTLNGFVQIGRLYFRGITFAKTQESARSLVDEIARGAQFSRDPISFVPPTAGEARGALCVGLIRYTYVLGKQQTENVTNAAIETRYAMWRDEKPVPSAACAPSDVSVNSIKIFGDGMRLQDFTVQPYAASNTWRVYASVSYGDDDLLEPADPITGRRRCKASGYAGVQFCATSDLETIVNRRLQ
jgi:prepilin-type N-terminal cleavage/methylation domain-containing protein